MPPTHSPAVDTYIANSAVFARPILERFRTLVHETCPEAEETIKWSFPHFIYRGTILCSIAAFKAHCAIGFWHHEMKAIVARDRSDATADAMGVLGRISSMADLPSDSDLRRYIRAAVQFTDKGTPARKADRKPRPELPVPADLGKALKGNPTARQTFENFSPSHRREYIEWITEAKRPATRAKRLATTLDWLSKGKPRNWQYMETEAPRGQTAKRQKAVSV